MFIYISRLVVPQNGVPFQKMKGLLKLNENPSRMGFELQQPPILFSNTQRSQRFFQLALSQDVCPQTFLELNSH